jgi:hypothetical protein
VPTTLAIQLNRPSDVKSGEDEQEHYFPKFDDNSAPVYEETTALSGETVFTKSPTIEGINDGGDNIRWDHTVLDLQHLTE